MEKKRVVSPEASAIGRALVALRYAKQTRKQRVEAARNAGKASGRSRRAKAQQQQATPGAAA